MISNTEFDSFLEQMLLRLLTDVLEGVIHDEDMKFISELVHRSYFVIPHREPMFMKAFQEFNAEESVTINKYHRSLCALLPQLEHSLRRIFVCVNDLPDSIMKAGINQFVG